MNAAFITTIAVNLGLLLLVSWVLGFIIFMRLLKDNQQVQTALQKAQKKAKTLQQALAIAQAAPPPEFPLEPVVVSDEEAKHDLLNALDLLSNDLLEKEQHLAMLAQLHGEQQQLLENWQHNNDAQLSDDVLDNHQKTQVMIDSLQTDLKVSQEKVKQLETQLREGKDKEARIAILEESERRLRQETEKLKRNQKQTRALADGLEKANTKNQTLRKENDKLKRNIKELANASEEQLQTIQKITTELDRVTRLEQHQRSVIDVLKGKLRQEKQSTNNSKQVSELEEKLQQVSSTLERTLREKEFIESHLLEMDKSLEQAKETEAALDRARKEIETLEMYFPEFDPDADENATATTDDYHEPLPQLSIDPEEEPALYNVVSDNRLFGIVNELWMTLDTPPLQLIRERDVKRPKQLQHWVKTGIHNNTFFVTIGASQPLIKTLAQAMFNKTDHPLTEGELKDALGELGNVLAGTLANELSAEFSVGISEHLSANDMESHLQQASMAAEALLTANNDPIYLALAKPVTQAS